MLLHLSFLLKKIIVSVKSFGNLSKEAVLGLWTAFLDIAEQFGVDFDTFFEICTAIRDEFKSQSSEDEEKQKEISDEEFEEICKKAFEAMA